jgi:hypothetical protein
MRSLWGKFCTWFKDYYIEQEGGKNRPKIVSLKVTGCNLLALFSLSFLFTPEDDSYTGRSDKPFTEKGGVEGETKVSESKNAKSVIDAHEADARRKSPAIKKVRSAPLVYNARQVFERQDLGSGTLTPLPSGVNCIGKLINGIDTRETNQTMRAVLPYGASHPSGGSIPRDSIILGSISYQGKGDRAYIRFNRVIFPDGSEYKIDAQALSSADYAPGLIGETHGQGDMRMIGSLGLTMASAAAEVLTEKSPLGGINALGQVAVEAKPNLKNAALQGISQASKDEAGRHAEVAKNQEEYLTINAGGDLIVSLLTTFRGEPL